MTINNIRFRHLNFEQVMPLILIILVLVANFSLYFFQNTLIDIHTLVMASIISLMGNIFVFFILKSGKNRNFFYADLLLPQLVWVLFWTAFFCFFSQQGLYFYLTLLICSLVIAHSKLLIRRFYALAWFGLVSYITLFYLAYAQYSYNDFSFVDLCGLFIYILIVSTLSIQNNHIRELHQEIKDRKNSLSDALQKIRHVSITDQLTGIYNRKQLITILEQQKAFADRGDFEFSLVLVDIDKFKAVNDVLGHDFGDKILKDIADMAQTTIRKADFAARYGGEEFLLILTGTSTENAVILAGRIQQGLEDIHYAQYDHSISASIGVTSYQPIESIIQVLKRLDKAVEKAKAFGGNTIFTVY